MSTGNPPVVSHFWKCLCVLVLLLASPAVALHAQEPSPSNATANPVSKPAVSAPDALPATTQDPDGTNKLRISTGDLVDINVYGVPDLARTVRVNSQGEVNLPLIGTLVIAGLGTDEAERLIESKYELGNFLNDPSVSVFVKEYATQGMSVLGEVTKPGIYPLLGQHRLFDALSAAGGLTDKAGRLVTITHRDKPTDPITVQLSGDPGKSTEGNVEVYPGDTIVVSKAGVVYVVGDVGRPSGFTMDQNERLTVLQAIALAEGTKPTASLDRAKLIRKTSAGLQEIPIPLKKILSAKSPDVTLQADDIVFVPSSTAKGAARRGLEAVLQTATGVAIYRR